MLWNYRIARAAVTGIPLPESGPTSVTEILDRGSGNTAPVSKIFSKKLLINTRVKELPTELNSTTESQLDNVLAYGFSRNSYLKSDMATITRKLKENGTDDEK